jgi:hypothetical protein
LTKVTGHFGIGIGIGIGILTIQSLVGVCGCYRCWLV